jgi:hypothetical protein
MFNEVSGYYLVDMKLMESSTGIKFDIVVELKTTCVISDYQHYSYEFEPRAWLGVLDTTLCEIRFVSDLRQVDGFLRVLRFPPPIKQ